MARRVLLILFLWLLVGACARSYPQAAPSPLPTDAPVSLLEAPLPASSTETKKDIRLPLAESDEQAGRPVLEAIVLAPALRQEAAIPLTTLDRLASLFPYVTFSSAGNPAEPAAPPWLNREQTLFLPLLLRGWTRVEQASALYNCPRAEYYIHVPDCTVLLLFYWDTYGWLWKEQRGWLNPQTHPCQWNGIICDNRRVRVVQVESNRMIGVLPPEIGQLNLTFLLVRNNQLRGTVPDSIAQLRELESLDLYENQFTGRLHPRIANLPRLHTLAFDEDELSFATELFTCDDMPAGVIPRQECQALVDIYRATGGEKWQVNTVYTPPPGRPGHFFADKWLVGNNPCYWKGINCVEKHVDILNLSSGNVQGRVPAAFGQFTALGQLDLSLNYLYGPLPVEFRNLTQLMRLRLAGNQLPPGVSGSDQTLLCIPAAVFAEVEEAINEGDMPPGGFCP